MINIHMLITFNFYNNKPQIKNNKLETDQLFKHASLISALERLRQEDPESQVNLGYLGRLGQ